MSSLNDAAEQPAPQPSTSLARTLSLGNERLFLSAAVLSAVPLWFSSNLPMIDLAQNVAQVAALREIWAGNELFTRLFEINWLTPYILPNLLLYLLSAVLPIAVATQVLVTASVVAIPLLTGSLLRAAGADERWRWLAIPCSFGFAFYWGFLSYLVAVPLALLFLVQTIRYANAPTRARAMGISAASVALFFCHVIAMGAACAVALAYVVGRYHRDWRLLLLRVLPYTAPLPLIALWVFSIYSNEASVSSGPLIYRFETDYLVTAMYNRLVEMLAQASGSAGYHALLTFLVAGAVIAAPALMGSRFSRRPERWLPFAAGLGLYMAMPAVAMGTAYLYHRLGVFLVPLWFLAWDAPAAPARRADWVPMTIVLIWIFANTGRFAAFARETEVFDDVLAQMEPGRRVAAMVVARTSPQFELPVYVHFVAWYQAKHGGVVDFNFGDFHPQMVRYRREIGPRMGEVTTWRPWRFQWEQHGGAQYDYFLIRAGDDVSADMFKEKRDAVELVTQNGGWWLYRNKERSAPRRAAHE